MPALIKGTDELGGISFGWSTIQNRTSWNLLSVPTSDYSVALAVTTVRIATHSQLYHSLYPHI